MNIKTLAKLQSIFNTHNSGLNVNLVIGKSMDRIAFNTEGVFCVNNILNDEDNIMLLPLLRKLNWTDNSIDKFLNFVNDANYEDLADGVYRNVIKYRTYEGTVSSMPINFIKRSVPIDEINSDIFTFIDFSSMTELNPMVGLYNFNIEELASLTELGYDINLLLKLYYPDLEVSSSGKGIVLTTSKIEFNNLKTVFRRLGLIETSIDEIVGILNYPNNFPNGNYTFNIDYCNIDGFVKTKTLDVTKESYDDIGGCFRYIFFMDFSSLRDMQC